MKLLISLPVFISIIVASFVPRHHGASDNDRATIEKTGAEIRAAFSRGDVPSILLYHHPEVVKALAYNKTLTGRLAVEEDLRATLSLYYLEFVENNIESILIHGDLAVEQTVFKIKGTPKKGGDSFLFQGRTLVVYKRYEKSPTGWASIREVIQPAVN